jgi:hypothetical protein
MQLAELREHVSSRGWEVFAEYVDSGIRLESSKTGISRIGDQPMSEGNSLFPAATQGFVNFNEG